MLAATIFLVALLLRFWMLPVEAHLPFLTFYPATVICLYLCGTGPSVLLVACCAVAGYYIFLPPFWSFAYNFGSLVATAGYIISSCLIFLIVKQLREFEEHWKSEQERLHQAEHYRETVVREVHHRVKNNLQGVIGLLELNVAQHPETTSAINTAIGKIKTVAVVFGLQGLRNEDDIRLCEITAEVCKSANVLSQGCVEPLVEVDLAHPIRLSKNKAVPVALIVNELVTNALKHGQVEPQRESIYVRISSDGQSATLTIRNKSLEPPRDFDFDLAKGLGTGLTLVQSMLPRDGSKLSMSFNNGVMEAKLELMPPVITIPAI